MENEIEVNEYIRTKDGFIDKIVDIRDTYSERKLIAFERSNSLKSDIGLKAMIVKHSSNLIDILEIGDFIHTDYGWGWYHHKVDENTIIIDDGDEFIDVKKDEIHRILTQEMLWNNSYEVKEKNK